jgi:hypothetical protein
VKNVKDEGDVACPFTGSLRVTRGMPWWLNF